MRRSMRSWFFSLAVTMASLVGSECVEVEILDAVGVVVEDVSFAVDDYELNVVGDSLAVCGDFEDRSDVPVSDVEGAGEPLVGADVKNLDWFAWIYL
jgi:hypothetical protein